MTSTCHENTGDIATRRQADLMCGTFSNSTAHGLSADVTARTPERSKIVVPRHGWLTLTPVRPRAVLHLSLTSQP